MGNVCEPCKKSGNGKACPAAAPASSMARSMAAFQFCAVMLPLQSSVQEGSHSLA